VLLSPPPATLQDGKKNAPRSSGKSSRGANHSPTLQAPEMANNKIAQTQTPTSGSSPSGRAAPTFNTSGLFHHGAPAGGSALAKRARRRAISVALSLQLADVTPDERQRRAYLRTVKNCCNTMIQTPAGQITTMYCSHRWCLVCSSIRTARAITSYSPEIGKWKNSQLVTLTIPNVSLTALRGAVKDMLREYYRITQWLQRRHGKARVKMLRSLEVTFSSSRGDAHPHFHILVEGAQVAQDLLSRWLVKFPKANILGQDIRPARAGAEIELLKYAVGLSTDKKGIDGRRQVVPPEALDAIFRAIKGVRLLGAVGFHAAVADDAAPVTDAPVTDGDEPLQVEGATISPVPSEGRTIIWRWSQENRNWLDFETGQFLTDYEPSRHVREFLQQLEGG
jgi:hypothetical protein